MTPKKPRISIYWWPVLLALIIWNIWMFLPKAQPAVDLPYSSFISQLYQGNVKNVTLMANQITGNFKEPVQFPEQIGGTTNRQTAIQDGQTSGEKYEAFQTVYPEAIGDTKLLPLLEAQDIEINAIQPISPWLALLNSNGLPLIMLVIVILWMGREAAKRQIGIFGLKRSKEPGYLEERPNVNFEDVAGMDEAKQELQEVIDFLRQPQKYHQLGARVSRGFLLVGSPGSGKTLMARAVAGEAGVPFFSICASEFVDVGASGIRNLFEQAKAKSPAIVYIDELDAVDRRRCADIGAEREQTLNQLLVEMDGIDDNHEITVLASTSRPDALDPTLLRPGRFDRQLTFGFPDRSGREGILRIHTRELILAPDVNLHILAQTTTGFSSADLANLCNEAALAAARKSNLQIKMDDFEEALDRILLRAPHTILLNEHERKIVAYHEAGHALAAWLTPTADPIRKVTIIPHSRASGIMGPLPGDDHYHYEQSYLEDRLTVMLAGRAAEELFLDDITSGGENDLVEATRLARRMVTRWGMGSLASMALDTDIEQPFRGDGLLQRKKYSEETAVRIDHDIENLLSVRYLAVHDLLSANSDLLDRLARALLKVETIGQDQLIEILGTRVFNLEEIPV